MSLIGSRIKLSVIVVSFSSPALLERCLSGLEAQTLQDGVELLVVWCPGAHEDGYHKLERRFCKAKWVRTPPGSTVPQMRRLGIKQSEGEVIALLEDDCVPVDTWHLELLKAHQGADAAIGGVVEPGNYTRGLDWAAYFQEYSRFMQPLPEGTVRALPGTNVSYKRSALGRFLGEDELSDEQFECSGFYEVFVHQELQHSGEVLKADPRLVVHNVNSWNCSQVLKNQFHHGRGFAAMRVAGRSLAGRLPFLGLAAFLPCLQVYRVLTRVIGRKRHTRRLAQAFPWIILISISWSLGELVGYLRGPGSSLQQWR